MPRAGSEIGQSRTVRHLLAQAGADGADHHAVIEKHHVHLRIVLGGRGLGQNVGRRARHDHHLDVVRLLEIRQDVLREGLLEIAAVHADVERLGLGVGCAGERRAWRRRPARRV